MVSNLERFRLEKLQSDLLGQHDVADGNPTFRQEAEQALTPTPEVELLDVQLATAQDTTAPSCITRHVEVAARGLSA
jgi:hypothetical protein